MAIGKNKLIMLNSKQKVISFRRDADFFSKKANQSWEKLHYEKALRYFKLATESDDSNPMNYCNMAGVLTDMGNYEESNEILWHVVQKLDPSLTECFFFMANNYAYMEKYEQSEAAIIQYLEHDHEGQYVIESEELIRFLQIELERPTSLKQIKSKQGLVEHEQARELLEEGKFHAATKILEVLVNRNPEFLAAYNNLAIAYYYMGYYEKALQAIEQVLIRDAGNLHALCNQAIFLKYLGRNEASEQIIPQLRKMYPFSTELLFKLATTMGILQQHDRAYSLFRRIIRVVGAQIDPSIHHYIAVAACHLGKFSEAKLYWLKIQKKEADSKIAKFYLDLLLHAPDQEWLVSMSYHYHLPHEDSIYTNKEGHHRTPEQFKKDPLIRSSFFWALRHGDQAAKLRVLHAFYLIADEEVFSILKDFISRVEEEEYVKLVASFVLRRLQKHMQLNEYRGEQQSELEDHPHTPGLPEWKIKWQAVLEITFQQMHKRYDVLEQYDAEILWVEFMTRVYPDIPKFVKIEGWSAAIEYLIAKMHSHPVSYQEMSLRYHVAVSTIQRNVYLIDHVCQIKQKMHAILSP